MQSPEELARQKIDALLKQCGWIIQDRSTINLSAGRKTLKEFQQFVTPDVMIFEIHSSGRLSRLQGSGDNRGPTSWGEFRCACG